MADSNPQTLTQDEFATHFRRAAPVLWCVAAATLGNRDGAEDAVQDAALSAMRRLDSFHAGTNFTAWMSKIVRFTALNQIRHARRGPQPLSDEDTVPATDTAPSVAVTSAGELLPDQSQFDDRVLHGLQSLSEEQRTCLLLRTVVDLSYREIAGMLGMPEGTAMSHVHRARHHLMERLRAPANEGTTARRMR